jgi:para-aminobenzoate synthetase
LNQISENDSVDVPHLMVVESYATVHQLVSTVVSTLRPEMTAVDAVMRSFPPGSMTGAPKLRTVQIIETLERIPRGIYSGVIGFFSVCGNSDFSVVIRTAVFNQKSTIF